MLEHSDDGALGYWCTEMLVHWDTGALGYWCTGILVHIVIIIVNSNMVI